MTCTVLTFINAKQFFKLEKLLPAEFPIIFKTIIKFNKKELLKFPTIWDALNKPSLGNYCLVGWNYPHPKWTTSIGQQLATHYLKLRGKLKA